MASAIVTKATTIEGQIFEIAKALVKIQVTGELELDDPLNKNPDLVTIVGGFTRNMETGDITFAVTLPSESETNPDGTVKITATPVFLD